MSVPTEDVEKDRLIKLASNLPFDRFRSLARLSEAYDSGRYFFSKTERDEMLGLWELRAEAIHALNRLCDALDMASVAPSLLELPTPSRRMRRRAKGHSE